MKNIYRSDGQVTFELYRSCLIYTDPASKNTSTYYRITSWISKRSKRSPSCWWAVDFGIKKFEATHWGSCWAAVPTIAIITVVNFWQGHWAYCEDKCLHDSRNFYKSRARQMYLISNTISQYVFKFVIGIQIIPLTPTVSDNFMTNHVTERLINVNPECCHSWNGG